MITKNILAWNAEAVVSINDLRGLRLLGNRSLPCRRRVLRYRKLCKWTHNPLKIIQRLTLPQPLQQTSFKLVAMVATNLWLLEYWRRPSTLVTVHAIRSPDITFALSRKTLGQPWPSRIIATFVSSIFFMVSNSPSIGWPKSSTCWPNFAFTTFILWTREAWRTQLGRLWPVCEWLQFFRGHVKTLFLQINDTQFRHQSTLCKFLFRAVIYFRTAYWQRPMCLPLLRGFINAVQPTSE